MVLPSGEHILSFRSVLEKIGSFLGAGLATTRTLRGHSLWAVRVVGFIFAAYFLFGAVNGSFTVFGPRSLKLVQLEFPYIPYYGEQFSLPIFICFTSVLTFLLYPCRENSPQDRPSGFDLLWCVLSFVVMCEFMYFYDDRGARAGIVEWNDVVFGFAAACLVWETCRRVLGLVLPIVAVVFLFYDWAGPIFPGLLSHKGAEFGYVMGYLYSQSGIYGVITRVYAQVVFIFLIFGALLQATRVGDVFVDLAFALVGRFKGGAAKASVVSSGLVGSIVGSGAANIVITGTFTIPLMKRAGFRATYAAATEAVASIGGHLMPPIMASAAFILAAMTETPYYKVALVSLVPALLYYLSVFMSVHYYASKNNLQGLSKEELPDFWGVLKKDGILLIPIVLLIMLLILQFSPFFAGFWAIVAAIVVSTIKQKCWYLLGVQAVVFVASILYGGDAVYLYLLLGCFLAWRHQEARRIMSEIGDAFVTGSVNSLVIGATAGVMGLVLTGVTHPDLAQKMTAIILSYSHNILWLAVALVALASYILGMGMTITASYILIAILAGPALMDFGLSMFTAHMIILWLSQDAALTPPFALGAFVAAGVAQCDPMRTGFISLKLAKPLYVVPLLMAYTPILINGPWDQVILVWVSAALGFICTSAALEGYFLRILTTFDRCLMGAAGVALFWNGMWYKTTGLSLMIVSIVMQLMRPKDFATPAPVEAEPTEG
ncbi:MAG: TRAP transporter fused permease subunit [Nitrospinae bacterium]|nr:TRAP transporter fused permease subunit [Nitrospinota bacterium]